MTKALVGRLGLCAVVALSVGGCGSMRQGESISRCTDCATALYRDNGGGGSIYNVASRSEDAVERVARRYCIEHGLGQPTVGRRYVPPMGSGFWGYDFSCGPRGQAPVARRPAEGDGEKLGATCTSLGFQNGTPQYDSCVLKLRQISSTQATEITDPAQQVRQRQREQAIRVLRQGLDSLSAQPPAACESPATMTIRLPCGDIVSCTKRGDQVSCD